MSPSTPPRTPTTEPQRAATARTAAALLATLASAGALTGCASLSGLPITHSPWAENVDRQLGQSVRQAQALQTLHPQAGRDPLLPDGQRARAALTALERSTRAAGMAGHHDAAGAIGTEGRSGGAPHGMGPY